MEEKMLLVPESVVMNLLEAIEDSQEATRQVSIEGTSQATEQCRKANCRLHVAKQAFEERAKEVERVQLHGAGRRPDTSGGGGG